MAAHIDSNVDIDIEEFELINEESLVKRDSTLNNKEKENLLKEALEFKCNGNEKFRTKEFSESLLLYSKGLQICPMIYTAERSILYANRAASKHKIGRKKSAIDDCNKAIELNSKYLKAYLRRAYINEELDQLDDALEDYKKILVVDPTNEEALCASKRLPVQINEKNEKLTSEMIDKLKDLGNTVLNPFGLSTNNFKMSKNPSGEGYSINFVQNP